MDIASEHKLNIKCSVNSSIEFIYTENTTIMDLKQYMEKQYKIPKEMQIIHRKYIRIEDTDQISSILEMRRDDIIYDFLFAVRLSKDLSKTQKSTIDEINTVCLENDITILKTITIRFVNGVSLAVIDITDENIKDIDDVENYIEHLYSGKFDLYHEHSKETIEDMYYNCFTNMFLDKSKTFLCGNLNLIFIPDFQARSKEIEFLDLHQINLFQKIRLVFITKEEVISTNQRLNINGLKIEIKDRFGYAPYQQTLFCNKRQLEDKELLTELCIEQEGGINTSEKLVIKVIVSKAKTVEVRVTCAFPLQNDTQFLLNVEDNLFARDLRQIIQDRIFHQGPLAMEVNEPVLLLKDSKMLFDIPEGYSDLSQGGLLRVTVYKVMTISFHERYKRIMTNTKPNDEIYIVKDTTETVQKSWINLNAENGNNTKSFRK